MSRRLIGKHVLITGSSEGLGRQLALDFAREGAAAIAIVARNGEKLESAREAISQIAPDAQVLTITADVSEESDIERIVATTLDAFQGNLDVLINNASKLGPSPMPLLVDYPLGDFVSVFKTNVVAPFLLIQKLLPALINNQGRIINVTSDAGITGHPGWGAYGISKFALEGLSRTWSAELAESGVKVNWVDPGDMNTAMHRSAEPDEDPSQWADPSAVTDIFIHLASDESNENGKRFLAQEDESHEYQLQL